MQASKMSVKELQVVVENFNDYSKDELAAFLKESLLRHVEVTRVIQEIAGSHRFNKAAMSPNKVHGECYHLAEKIGLFNAPGEFFQTEMLNDSEWRARNQAHLCALGGA